MNNVKKVKAKLTQNERDWMQFLSSPVWVIEILYGPVAV